MVDIATVVNSVLSSIQLEETSSYDARPWIRTNQNPDGVKITAYEGCNDQAVEMLLNALPDGSVVVCPSGVITDSLYKKYGEQWFVIEWDGYDLSEE